MQPSSSTLARALAAALLLSISAQPASAACTKLGFTVNDFGKDGPTKDAKGLLDKYIAKWAADHKIAKYRTGTKDVKCELFLNLIVVDEHTCRAEATVCWDGAPVTPAVIKAEGGPDANKPDANKPAAAPKAPLIKRATAPATPSGPAAAPAPAAAKPAAKAAVTPVVTPLETGTLPAVAKPVAPAAAAPIAPVEVPAPAAAPIAPSAPKAAAAEPAVADQALAVAQKAAAAAERAAAAAERAAAAAQAAERVNAPAAAKP